MPSLSYPFKTFTHSSPNPTLFVTATQQNRRSLLPTLSHYPAPPQARTPGPGPKTPATKPCACEHLPPSPLSSAIPKA